MSDVELIREAFGGEMPFAVNVSEPFATLLARGAEIPVPKTFYGIGNEGQPLLIYASLFTRKILRPSRAVVRVEEPFGDLMYRLGVRCPEDNVGKVVAVATLKRTVPVEEGIELPFGPEWDVKRMRNCAWFYLWTFENVRPLANPFPVPKEQTVAKGFWQASRELEDAYPGERFVGGRA